MAEPTDEQRLAAIPKYTHEYYEEQACQKMCNVGGLHFSHEQVERIIARLRMIEYKSQ